MSGDKATLESLAILTQLSLLGVALTIGHQLQKRKIQWIGEAGVALLLGVLVGLLVNAGGKGTEYRQILQFKSDFFFFALLPPVMFNAGYSLNTKQFFDQLGSICCTAFIGTTISTFIMALVLWLTGRWGWTIHLTGLHAMVFGSLISATDPVSVLAVFQSLDADQDLYINVFGESVLNDAVAMVLFNTVASFLVPGHEVSSKSIVEGVEMFVGIFVGSVLVGSLMGLFASWVFKVELYKGAHSPVVESGMVIVFAYSSYLLASACQLSGIVSIMFCGMVMSKYTRPNLAPGVADNTRAVCEILAGLAELFVFVYIGTSLSLGHMRGVWSFVFVSLVALAISRAANIYPLMALVNFLRPEERRLGANAQFMMWWSGLRGAMAFALAVDAAERFGEEGEVMMRSTLFIIIITVLINGGGCASLLDRLNLRRSLGGFSQLRHGSFSLVPITGQNSVDVNGIRVSAGGSSEDSFAHVQGSSPSSPSLQPLASALSGVRQSQLLATCLDKLDKQVLSPILLRSEQPQAPVASAHEAAEDEERTQWRFDHQ